MLIWMTMKINTDHREIYPRVVRPGRRRNENNLKEHVPIKRDEIIENERMKLWINVTP